MTVRLSKAAIPSLLDAPAWLEEEEEEEEEGHIQEEEEKVEEEEEEKVEEEEEPRAHYCHRASESFYSLIRSPRPILA